MQQKIIVSNTSDIDRIADEISLFHTHRRTIRVHMNQFSEAENREIESRIVKHYAAKADWGKRFFGSYSLAGYFLLVVMGVIPASQIGIVANIVLYIFLSLMIALIVRWYGYWWSRRELHNLAKELQTAPSFGYL